MNIFIFGQKKSATTTLFETIVRNAPNRYFFFGKESRFLELNYVLRYFIMTYCQRRCRYIIDGTTDYDWSDDRIYQRLPADSLVLIMIRNERDRSVSHYKHAVRFSETSLEFTQFLNSADYIKEADLSVRIEHLKRHSVQYKIIDTEAIDQTVVQLLGLDKLIYEDVNENQYGAREPLKFNIDRLLMNGFVQVVVKCLPKSLRHLLKMTLQKKNSNMLDEHRVIKITSDDKRIIEKMNSRNNEFVK